MKWIRSGNQREAVARVVRKPLTSLEIFALARKEAPKMRLHDVSVILRDFVRCGLGYFLNPMDVTGRLFFLTDIGRDVCYRAFGIQIDVLPDDVDWKAYGRVVRARLRKWVLLQLAAQHRNRHFPRDVRGIYNVLRQKRSIAYSALLTKAVESIAITFRKRLAGGLQSERSFVIPDQSAQANETTDFELITWLVIKSP